MEARAIFRAAGEHGLGVFGDIQIAVGDVLHRFADVAGVIFREVARIRPRVGDHFVLFVERLGDLKRAFGGKRGFALESGEVVELGGDLGLALFFLRDFARFAGAASDDGFGGLLVPDALGF